jgi:hypothetical protein
MIAARIDYKARYEQLYAAIEQYLCIEGNDLCHDGEARHALALAIGQPELAPLKLIDEAAFKRNCELYRLGLYHG